MPSSQVNNTALSEMAINDHHGHEADHHDGGLMVTDDYYSFSNETTPDPEFACPDPDSGSNGTVASQVNYI